MAERKSTYHGLTTDDHGPDERGLGALASPEDPRDFPLAQLLATTGPVAAYPTSWVEPNTPPVTNQGTTPQCVAYSSGYDQNHMDRVEDGKFVDFNEPRFFTLIGGSSAGAYMRSALDRRLHYGYPVTGLGDASQTAHKIKAYYRVPLDATSIKAALLQHLETARVARRERRIPRSSAQLAASAVGRETRVRSPGSPSLASPCLLALHSSSETRVNFKAAGPR